jgi:membrane fusion protein (multidrug efflux system)
MRGNFLSKSAQILKTVLIILLFVNATPKKSVQVEVSSLKEMNFHEEYIAIGECKLANSKDFIAKTNGKIDSINIQEGKGVKAGDILLTINSAEAYAANAKAQNAFKQAVTEYNKALELYKEGFISETLLEEAQAQLYAKKADLESNYTNYKNMVVKATNDGRIGAVYVKMEEEVEPNKKLFSFIADNSLKNITLNLPENMYQKIRHDSEIYTVDMANNKVYGKIIALSECLTEKGAWQIKVSFPQTTQLLHNSYVPVTFIYNKHIGIGIEEKVVQRNNNGIYIFQVIENKAKILYIKSNTRINGFIEIMADNLNIGDLIITKGLTKVSDGLDVKVINKDVILSK